MSTPIDDGEGHMIEVRACERLEDGSVATWIAVYIDPTAEWLVDVEVKLADGRRGRNDSTPGWLEFRQPIAPQELLEEMSSPAQASDRRRLLAEATEDALLAVATNRRDLL